MQLHTTRSTALPSKYAAYTVQACTLQAPLRTVHVIATAMCADNREARLQSHSQAQIAHGGCKALQASSHI
eukprot:21485-Heterococcus_DN1.PRE.2